MSTFTVEVTDSSGLSATEPVSLTITAGPSLSFPAPPSGNIGSAYSDTLTASGGTGPYAWSVSSGSLPAGVTLGSVTGTLSGTPTAAGSSTFTVQVTDADGQSATEATSLAIVSAPALSFPAPPSGEVGTAYTDTLTASGGTGPYAWSVSSGSLPAGITLGSVTGTLSGTPIAAGSSHFTVQVTGADGQSATEATSLAIISAPALSFPAPPSGQVGTAYTDTLTASGGTGPYTWSVSSGSLPNGVTLGSTTGTLSGTPTALGTFHFTVQVTDADDETAAEAVSLAIAPSVVLSASASSVTFGTSVTLTATVTPSAATGAVVFADKLSSGPQSGQVVTLGTAALSAGTAALTIDLPAFKINTVTAAYSGDATYAGATSAPAGVRVTAYSGEVLIGEFRLSGPLSFTEFLQNDQYAELYNSGPPVSLAGFVLAASGVAGVTSITVPASAPVLPTGGAYLITASNYSLSAPHDLEASYLVASEMKGRVSIGSDGLKVTAPDGLGTVTDAVGSAGAGTGYYSGTALPALSGLPTDQYAWVRVEAGGVPANTGNNIKDFQLVSTTGGVVGGVQSALGSPSPRDTGSPGQANGVLRSALLDPARPVTAAPNFVYVHGTPGLLTIRRTLTNSSSATITAAELRITSLSEANGPPEPGGTTQPPAPAQLRVINAAAASPVTITGGTAVTVQNLSVNPPASYSPAAPSTGGGGLNTTLTIPLPTGGLAPGASVSIALSCAVDQHGPYWYGYDVDALATPSLTIAGARTTAPAAALIPPRPPGPMSRQAIAKALRYVGGHGVLP